MTENYSDYSLRSLLHDHPDTEITISYLDHNGDLKIKIVQRNDEGKIISEGRITLQEDLALCGCNDKGVLEPVGYDILFRKLDSLKEEDKNNV